MVNVVNFNMVVEINQLLKEQAIEYSLHALGGCTCTGLRLRRDGEEYQIKKIKLVIELAGFFCCFSIKLCYNMEGD